MSWLSFVSCLGRVAAALSFCAAVSNGGSGSCQTQEEGGRGSPH